MKKYIKPAVAVVLSILLIGTGAVFGKKYFDENYVLLNQEEIAAVNMQISMLRMDAYAAGLGACKKTT